MVNNTFFVLMKKINQNLSHAASFEGVNASYCVAIRRVLRKKIQNH